MGLLVKGKWHDQWYDTDSTGGSFVRSDSRFRNWITPDGSAGPSGVAGFKAEAGRYHLYVSYACPWANRVLILRAQADYSGRVTVPILWDLQQNTIVNNESSEIIRMLNTAFDGIGATKGDYAPVELLPQIDEINAHVYDVINNGVYKAGFATSQVVYEQEVNKLFACLDQLEVRLGQQRYLLGERITEADWRLFTTLIRFDAVYYGHFKCNIKRLSDYKNLWSYTRELYQWPGIAQTVNLDHIKQHYYRSHWTINPNGIVPVGPILDLNRTPDRHFNH